MLLRQLVPFPDIDHQMTGGRALPPGRIVVVLRDLAEPEFLVVIGANPFGRVDGALLQRRIDIAGSDLLRYAAELLDRQSGKTADAEFEALEVGDFLDLLAEPSAHLAPGVGGRKRVDIELLAELIHQLHAGAVIEPGILLTGI